MRKLIVTELISLDGVVDSPGSGQHPRAGWSFKEVDFEPAAYEIEGREQDEAAAMLLGRVSYEEFAPVLRQRHRPRRLRHPPLSARLLRTIHGQSLCRFRFAGQRAGPPPRSECPGGIRSGVGLRAACLQ
jgi:hypothetical protein